jgi:hypothetical protein
MQRLLASSGISDAGSVAPMTFPLLYPLRSPKRLDALLLAACAAIVYYSAWSSIALHATGPATQTAEFAPIRDAVDGSAAVQSQNGLETVAPVIPSEPAAPQPLSARDMEKLKSAATEGDPATRADAIFVLGSAPRSQAAPVLHKILIGGDTVDGHLALDSLRTLALTQGDADGVVREAVRYAIYHGTSDTITQSAQEILDELENAAQ